ncbi:hypothetical protein Sjap_007957 [Stephania japonica]|uniref:Mon2/Sec7/BIG1-like dimerisation and cyclophilin-binding domain-containing protein n=1 Tax=Stephania japonica TaxID=461633 RepID=A0AAP0PAF0_9MAGN
MAFTAVLESDLRALSAEARRRYPAIKDGAEHAILKVELSFRFGFEGLFSDFVGFVPHEILSVFVTFL